MKLFDYVYYEDYGHEWYFHVLSNYPKFAFIDCVVQWDEFPATEWFPSILFGIGPHDLFGISIRYRKFEIRFNLLHFKPRNLEWYRTGSLTYRNSMLFDEPLLNSLQGTMATIDPYSAKKEAIDENYIDTIEERLTCIEDKVNLLSAQLKLESYKK